MCEHTLLYSRKFFRRYSGGHWSFLEEGGFVNRISRCTIHFHEERRVDSATTLFLELVLDNVLQSVVHFQRVECGRTHFAASVDVELTWCYRMIESILVYTIHSIVSQGLVELKHQLWGRRGLLVVFLSNRLRDALTHRDQLTNGQPEVTDRGQDSIFQTGHPTFESIHALFEIVQTFAWVYWTCWGLHWVHGQFPLLALKIATTFELIVWISLPTL
ncbi:hypothetical protein D3C80_1021940 [compost metagenome]